MGHGRQRRVRREFCFRGNRLFHVRRERWKRRRQFHRGRFRRRGAGARFQFFQLDVKPGERPLEVDLLAAQCLEELAIFGRHACGYYVVQAGGSKASQKWFQRDPR
jgi:hypothetical protein